MAANKLGRSKLTAAEREARGEGSFAQNRPRRDAARRQHVAETMAALDKTARICSAAAARKAAILLELTDRTARRKDRIKRRRAMLADYRRWIEQAPAWLKETEL